MRHGEIPSAHPLKTLVLTILGFVIPAALLAPFVYLLVFHTFGCLALLAMIGLAILGAREIAVWRFARANEGRTFLLCTRRHGWHDFIMNNVGPVLPQSWTIVWYVPVGKPERHPLLLALPWWRREERPVAIRPRGRRLERRPLRPALQPLKLRSGTRRDPEIQAEVRRLLDHAF